MIQNLNFSRLILLALFCRSIKKMSAIILYKYIRKVDEIHQDRVIKYRLVF